MIKDDARLMVASGPLQAITAGRLPNGPLQVVGLSGGQPRLVTWQIPDDGSWRCGQTLPSRGWLSYTSLTTVVDRRGNLVVFGLADDGTPQIVCVQRATDWLWTVGGVINGLPRKVYTMIAAGVGRDGSPHLCGITAGGAGLPEIIAAQDLAGQWNYGGPIAPAAAAGRYRSLLTVASPVASPQILALGTDGRPYRVALQNPGGGWRHDGAPLPWPSQVNSDAVFSQLVVGLGNGVHRFPQLLGLTDGSPALICWADGDTWHPGFRVYGPDDEKYTSLCTVRGAKSRLNLIGLTRAGTASLAAFQDPTGAWTSGQRFGDGRTYTALTAAPGNADNVQVVGITPDGSAYLVAWQNSREAWWVDGGFFPQPPPPVLELHPGQQAPISGTVLALTATRVAADQALTGITIIDGKLRMTSWTVDRTGALSQQMTSAVKPPARYAGMATISPRTYLLAYRNTTGTMTVSSWSVDAAGAITHLKDLTTSFKVDFPDGIDGCRIGVAVLSDDIWVTAHRSETGALILASWHLGGGGTITAVADTVGPDVTAVQLIATAGNAVATAVRLSEGDQLQLQRWHIGDVYLTEAATTGPQGAITPNLRLTQDTAGNLIAAVTPAHQPDQLRLIAWRADSRGRFQRCGEGGDEAGSVANFDVSPGPDGRLVVAAGDALSVWQTDSRGQITWLGNGPVIAAPETGSPVRPVLMVPVTGAAPVVAGFLSGDALRLQSFAVTQQWNQRLASVEAAFRAVADDGHAERLTSDRVSSMVGDHLQGMALYKEFVLLTKNVYFGDGLLLTASRATQTLLDSVATPDGRQHPAGCQVIGDYLAMAIESNSSSDGKVRFYDLTTLSQQQPRPKLMNQPQITCTAGAGAVGATDVGAGADRAIVVAVYDRGITSFYRSTTARLTDRDCEFEHLFDAERPASESLQHVQNIALVTDVVGGVHLVVFATTKTWGDFPDEDWMGLYRVDLEGKSLQYVAERHMYTDTISIREPLDSSVHFRWGAGLSVVSDSELMFYCCQRNFIRPPFPWQPYSAAINTFRA